MRLIDIEVDEVSLVDKAANNRSFVMKKRDVEVKKEEPKVEVKEVVVVEVVKENEPTKEDMEVLDAIGNILAELKTSL